MISSKDFVPVTVQTAVFTPDASIFTTGKAAGVILTHFRERFDGEMQVPPLLANIMPEIPRLFFQSGNGRYRLTMSSQRIDSLWQSLSEDDSEASSQSLSSLVNSVAEVQIQYVKDSGAPVNRLGLVVHRSCAVANPPQTLIDLFCNERSRIAPFNHSVSFEIHNHKAYTIPSTSWQINSWVRCKATQLATKPAILVEQDLNTQMPTGSEARQLFDEKAMVDFFQTIGIEADEILGKYFG